ncbi:hypothetical protein HPB51_005888 [Rhipicephalus microplus]|uniref:Late endosomal/lysosomal adaptor and MAPK and MTOR activator 5 n=1 Tax=Rhipicephalus microplus TaxID=6941 RepID=A0A9J6D444_RHIMP|nr:hypothetical protein HPB51_005888 [Rhipicephalus microplus]
MAEADDSEQVLPSATPLVGDGPSGRSVESGAVGIICADRHGLALHSSGPVQLKSAGVIATLASLAKEIDPSCDTTPTIHLESDSLDIMIQQKELVTVGVYSAAKK